MSVINALREKVNDAEEGAKTIPIAKRRKIGLAVLAACVVLLAVAALAYVHWRDVALVVSDRHVCSDMVSRGFQVGAGDTAGGCRVEHVSVDVISAYNFLGEKYKASQANRAFDINKNLVSVEH